MKKKGQPDKAEKDSRRKAAIVGGRMHSEDAGVESLKPPVRASAKHARRGHLPRGTLEHGAFNPSIDNADSRTTKNVKNMEFASEIPWNERNEAYARRLNEEGHEHELAKRDSEVPTLKTPHRRSNAPADHKTSFVVEDEKDEFDTLQLEPAQALVNTTGAFAIHGQSVRRRVPGFIFPPGAQEQLSASIDYASAGAGISNSSVDTATQIAVAAEVASHGDFEARVRHVLAQSTVPAENVVPVENREEHTGQVEASMNVSESSDRRTWRRPVVLVTCMCFVVAIAVASSVGITLAVILPSESSTTGSSPGSSNTNSSSSPATSAPSTSPPTLPTGTLTTSPTETLEPIPLLSGTWEQVGLDINGHASGDRFGWAVSMSKNASVVAVGAPGRWSSLPSPDYVSVYQYNEETSNWQQIGQDLVGDAVDDEYGWSIALNSAGNTLAVGAPENDANGDTAGHVVVYRYDPATSSWAQMGQDLHGEAAFDEFGISVSLSDSGETLAVGAWYSDNENGPNSGRVLLYQYNSTISIWQQMGQRLQGGIAEQFGRSVCLNGAGDVVGASEVNGIGHFTPGHVRVYQFDPTASLWNQVGTDIGGDTTGDEFGIYVSLSTSGRDLAVGARFSGDNESHFGSVQAHRYNSATSLWNQRGQTIGGEAAGDELGWSVSLSDLANVLAAGARFNGNKTGHVRLYQYDVATNTWTQLGQDIKGEASDDLSGESVALSGNGDCVVIGAPGNDGNGDNSGHVRVYSLT